MASHEFVFVSEAKTASVSVAGTFNNWNKDANPLTLSPDGKTWVTTVKLSPGRQAYKFVVNGSQWIADPNDNASEDDGGGGNNSILYVLPTSYNKPAVRGDGIITNEGIEFKPESPYVSYDGKVLTFRLKTRAGDVDRVVLHVDDLHVENHPITCTLKSSDQLHDLYQATVNWNGHNLIGFSFEVVDGKVTVPVAAESLTPDFKPIQVPGWSHSAVFYQIFPDRFEDGDKSNDPEGTVDWNSQPQYNNFFGGDLKGIDDKIPYLKKLGVSALYLTPVFKGPSNHGYETTDYRQIEPRFGTNRQFHGLVQNLHQNGIKIVLDGVFNHTATNFFAFDDIVKKGSSSQYKDWYFIKSYPVVVKSDPPYEAWWNYASMPKLNVVNPKVADYLLKSSKYWLQDANVDGWRLDSADVIDTDFLQKFRTSVKSDGANKWILGEIWVDANKWLQGDMFDSVMNYPFQKAVLGFVARKGGRASDLQENLFGNYYNYAPQVSRNLFNLLSSHDTPRFLTQCGGNKNLAAMGAVLQFTWPGTPSVYYGEELGMEGAKDPDNRRGMRWDLASNDNPTLKLYTKLIHLRRTHAALTEGEPIPVLADDSHQIFSFGRILAKDKAIIVVNRSETEQEVDLSIPPDLQLTSSRVYVDALTGKAVKASKEHGLALTLDPLSSAVLLAENGT